MDITHLFHCLEFKKHFVIKKHFFFIDKNFRKNSSTHIIYNSITNKTQNKHKQDLLTSCECIKVISRQSEMDKKKKINI